MLSKKIVLTNKTGLHSRPAADFVKKSNEFKSTMRIKKGDKEIDAKSIIALLTLGAAYGTEIELIIDGEDEQRAMDEMAAFFQQLKD